MKMGTFSKAIFSKMRKGAMEVIILQKAGFCNPNLPQTLLKFQR